MAVTFDSSREFFCISWFFRDLTKYIQGAESDHPAQKQLGPTLEQCSRRNDNSRLAAPRRKGSKREWRSVGGCAPGAGLVAMVSKVINTLQYHVI